MADIAGFTAFLRNTVGIPISALPDGSQAITDAFNFAEALVLCEMKLAGDTIYNLCLYCCGTSFIFNWAPDQPNMTYFAVLRKKFNLDSFTAGVVSASSDESTSTTLTVPDWWKDVTLSDLQFIKDPYGRQYLALMQRYGTLWGLT